MDFELQLLLCIIVILFHLGNTKEFIVLLFRFNCLSSKVSFNMLADFCTQRGKVVTSRNLKIAHGLSKLTLMHKLRMPSLQNMGKLVALITLVVYYKCHTVIQFLTKMTNGYMNTNCYFYYIDK